MTEHSRAGVDSGTVAAVHELLYAYAAALDAFAPDHLVPLVADDVVLDRGHERIEGSADVLDFYRGVAAADVATSQHMITNIRVSPAEGVVRATANFLAISTGPFGARLVWGAYEDDVVVIDGNACLLVKRIRVARSALIPESMLVAVGTPAFVAEKRS